MSLRVRDLHPVESYPAVRNSDCAEACPSSKNKGVDSNKYLEECTSIAITDSQALQIFILPVL
jgi:hypothetical protein